MTDRTTPEPVAYLYEDERGNRILLFSRDCDFAREKIEQGWAETPLYADLGNCAASASNWQPIESAPKDGRYIDVWIEGEFAGRRTDVSWRKPTDSEWWVHGGDTIDTCDACWHDCFGPLSKCEQPTHWLPHPIPPEGRTNAA